MSLFSRMKADNSRILSSEDMGILTLYNKAGDSLTGRGRWTNPGMFFDPQGFRKASKKWTVGFHIEDFSDIIGVNETYEGWEAEFVNSSGEIIKGVFNGPIQNKTFGYIVTPLTDIE